MVLQLCAVLPIDSFCHNARLHDENKAWALQKFVRAEWHSGAHYNTEGQMMTLASYYDYDSVNVMKGLEIRKKNNRTCEQINQTVEEKRGKL